MIFKGVDFFPHGTRFPIMAWRRLFVGISLALVVGSALLLASRGLNFGVDFKGGSLIEVKAKAGAIDVSALRERLAVLGLGEPQVQGVGTSEALIRIGQQPGATEVEESRAQDAANQKVRAALETDHEIRRIEVVGPAVSQELKITGLLALMASIAGIMIYVWFRFEWQFAVAAIAALVHDVFVTVGMFSLLWYEFDLSVVAALLTIAGYSINDTVVIFDRVRENMRKYKKMPIDQLLDLSLNETLSRTVLTSGTLLIAVLALYMFGTTVIEAFTFAMLFGVVIGSYSTLFIASPILMWLGVRRETVVGDEAKSEAGAKSGAGASPALDR
jgi:preprotein translocase SecF subunit